MRTVIIAAMLAATTVVAALIVGPGWVDWTERRGLVEGAIERLTGWRVETEGDIRFRILPQPRLDLGRFRVVSGPFARDSVSGQIGALQAVADLSSLFTGNLSLQRLVVVSPDLHWRRVPRPDDTDDTDDTDETDETDDTDARGVEAGPAGAPEEAARDGWLGLSSIDRLTVESGQLLVSGPDMAAVRVIDLTAGGHVSGVPGPAELSLSGRWQGVPLTATLRTGPTTRSGALPLSVAAEIAGLDGDARFAGLLLPTGELSGDVDLMFPDIAGLGLALSGRDAPMDVSEVPVSATAMVDRQGAGARFTSLRLAVGETSGQGSLTVGWEDGLTADLTLALDRLNLGDPSGPAGQLADAFLAHDGLATLAEALPPALLDELSANFDVTVNSARVRDGLFTDLRICGHVEGASLRLDAIRATGPGQTEIRLSGAVAVAAEGPVIDLLGRFDSNDFRAFLAGFGVDLPDLPADRLRRVVASGRLDGRPGELRLTGGEVQVDGSQVDLGMAYMDGPVPGIGLRLDLDRLDVDRYLPGLAAAPVPPLVEVLETARALAGRVNLNVDATVGSLVVGGDTWQDIRLDATLAGAALSLREARLGGAAGAGLSAAGYIADLAALSGLDLRITGHAAPTLASVLDLIGWPVPPVLAALGVVDAEVVLGGTADELSVSLLADGSRGHMEFAGSIAGAAAGWAGAEIVGTARLRHRSVADLARAVADPLTLPAGLGEADAFAEIALGQDGWSAGNVQVVLGPVSLVGSLRSDAEDGWIRGDFRLGRLNLGDWLGDAGRWPLDRLGDWSEAPLSGPWPEGWTPLDLNLSGAVLAWQGLEIAEPRVRLMGDASGVVLEGLSGRALGGQLAADARLASGAVPNLTVQLDLVDIALEDFLATILRTDGITGTAGLSLAVTGEGRTPAELVRSLSGVGEVAVASGEIAGLDLAAMDDALARRIDPIDFVDLVRRAGTSGTTGFAAIAAPLTVTEGVITSDAVSLTAGRGTASGSGLFDLADWDLRLDLDFALFDHPDAPGFGLSLAGPPRAPLRHLRSDALQAHVAERYADDLTEQFGGPPDDQPPADPSGGG
ncbi:MAG: AsmA family protein [Rhodospirillaceae bacterium]|nr:AsmA family protein [Rhodospirillaceae bacterium]